MVSSPFCILVKFFEMGRDSPSYQPYLYFIVQFPYVAFHATVYYIASMNSNVAHKKIVKQNQKMFLSALNSYAKDYGIVELSKKTKIPRTHLYKALSSDGNPTIETVLSILVALDSKLLFDISYLRKKKNDV